MAVAASGKSLARLLERWPIALGAVLVLAAALLLPGLGSSGLWEPQERQLADREAPRRTGSVAELEAMVRPAVQMTVVPRPNVPGAPQLPPPAPLAEDAHCLHVPPHDAVARTLTARAIGWGRDVDDSDSGRRLPFALLGLVTVLATAGIAMRLAGARAGVLTALVLLSMPLLVLQSRQLTSEIGTAAGSALVLYGLVALARERRGLWAILDLVVAAVSIVVGIALGFASGGALLGVLVPVGAFAAAGALGLPAIVAAWRAIVPERPAVAALYGRRAGEPEAREPHQLGDAIKALVATAVAIAVVAGLAYQLYDLREPQPGLVPPQRAVLGHAIVPDGCWSSLLGGIWRPEDDLRYIFDSTFEQIAYGTFPWGLLAPIAIGALLAGKDAGRRRLGALALAWGGGAWIAAEVFQRKVGFTIYAGFPALALAVGVWLDGIFRARQTAETPGRSIDRRSAAEQGSSTPQPDGPPEGGRGSALLVGTYAVLGVLVLGKDMQSFPARLPSLLVGGDAVPYPKMSHLAFLPTKLFLLVLGLLVALAFALAITRLPRRVARGALAGTLAGTALVCVFWPFAWQPELGVHLSSKSMFDTLHELATPADTLVIMGDLGDAPHDYAPDLLAHPVTSRQQIVDALGQPNRVFAIAPQGELCQLHHDLAHQPYFVVDDRDERSLLLSNRIDGTSDKNPLRDKILHEEPKQIRFRPKPGTRIVWDNRIELLGWDIPPVVDRGSKFQVKMYYKVLQPIGGAWHVLFHFDGSLRFNGDHMPIDDRCSMALWSAGDYIVDTTTVMAGGPAFAKGQYEVWTGFFTGAAPNFKNMPVSEAPPQMRDTTDRVKITTITLQ